MSGNYTQEQVIKAVDFIKPYIDQAIQIVEATDKNKPGAIKKQAAAMILNGLLYLMGKSFNLTPEIKRIIDGAINLLIDIAVQIFNHLGIFQKKAVA